MSAPKMLGPYDLIERLAVGGMAEIYLARRESPLGMEKHYAVKVILPQHAEDEKFRKMLIDEATLTAQLEHPNIAGVHDLGEDDGRMFIAMEYVHGEDLAQVLAALYDRGESVPDDISAYIAMEMCSALSYAHTRTRADGTPLDIVHRDISPQNVVVGFEGDVKLVDFGVAKASEEGRLETRTGVIKGKLRYMAPEYAVGNLQDARSDIFSTGLCLQEMVTGQPAYNALELEPEELVDRIKKASVPDVVNFRPDIPDDLALILRTALRAHPNQRYQTAREMQEALAEFLSRVSPGFTEARVAQFLEELRTQLGKSPTSHRTLLGEQLETSGIDFIEASDLGVMRVTDAAGEDEDTAVATESAVGEDPSLEPTAALDLDRLDIGARDVSEVDEAPPGIDEEWDDATEELPLESETISPTDPTAPVVALPDARLPRDGDAETKRPPADVMNPGGHEDSTNASADHTAPSTTAELPAPTPPEHSGSPNTQGAAPPPGQRPPATAAGAGPQAGFSSSPPPQERPPASQTSETPSFDSDGTGFFARMSRRFDAYAQTERGRETINAAIVGLLAIVMLGLFVYLFFTANT